jgi:hypothetical protein
MTLKELLNIVNAFYPKENAFNDPELKENRWYDKLSDKCFNAKNNQGQWIELITQLKRDLKIEITEFILLDDLNPSFIAVLLTESYTRPESEGYEPCQLILKISVLAPVYCLYFDNFVSTQSKRLIRNNPITDKEKTALIGVKNKMKELYPSFTDLTFQWLSTYCLI